MKITNVEEAANIIKDLRVSSNLSREKVSQRSGIIGTAIEKIEKHKRVPTLSTFLKIINALDYDLTLVERKGK